MRTRRTVFDLQSALAVIMDGWSNRIRNPSGAGIRLLAGGAAFLLAAACGKAPSRDAPVPDVSPGTPPVAEKPPGGEVPGRVVLRGGKDGFPLVVSAEDRPVAERVLHAMEKSNVWMEGFHTKNEAVRWQSPKPELHVHVARKGADADWFAVFGFVDPDSGERVGPTRFGFGSESGDSPLYRAATPEAAIAKAGLSLLIRQEPSFDRLVREIVDRAKPTRGAERGVYLEALDYLAQEGGFDARMAALELRAVPVAEQLEWEGDADLVEYAKKVVEEPLWQVLGRLRMMPERIKVECEVELKPLKPAPGYTVTPGGYTPGIATARISFEGNQWYRVEIARHGTPPSTYGDPYRDASRSAIHKALVQVAMERFCAQPKRTRQEYFEYAIWQHSKFKYQGDFHAEMARQLRFLADGHAGNLDMLVDALGSRMDRVYDSSRGILDALGSRAAKAVVKGLSHRSSAVGSHCALIVRIDGKAWRGSFRREIVESLTATLEDPSRKPAYLQTLFLLRDLGRAASAALPAIDAVAADERLAVFEADAREAADRIRGH